MFLIFALAGSITDDKLSTITSTGKVNVSSIIGILPVSAGGTGNGSGKTQFVSLGVGTPASNTTGEIRATNNVTDYYSDERLKTF